MKHWTPTQNHNKQHTNIYALKPPFIHFFTYIHIYSHICIWYGFSFARSEQFWGEEWAIALWGNVMGREGRDDEGMMKGWWRDDVKIIPMSYVKNSDELLSCYDGFVASFKESRSNCVTSSDCKVWSMRCVKTSENIWKLEVKHAQGGKKFPAGRCVLECGHNFGGVVVMLGMLPNF